MPTILVVEDDPLNQELFKNFLTHIGYEVITAVTAEEGIALARQVQPALILMDWRLPGGMDGLQATQALKRDRTTAHIPVVLATAHRRPGDEELVYEAGCEGYILKPINITSLKTAIGAQLSSR